MILGYDFYKNEPYMIRRSRGMRTIAIYDIHADWKGQVLAVGGELKEYILYRCGQQVLSVTICGRFRRFKNRKGIAGNDPSFSNIVGSRTTGCGL